jgi:hypothetical protein
MLNGDYTPCMENAEYSRAGFMGRYDVCPRHNITGGHIHPAATPNSILPDGMDAPIPTNA